MRQDEDILDIKEIIFDDLPVQTGQIEVQDQVHKTLRGDFKQSFI